ncbi:MAG: 3-keto-disaccharide hydrolase [Flavitalea sp.]
MNRIIAIAAFVALVGFSSSRQSSSQQFELINLSTKDKQDGWKLLFDGTSKNGWHVYNAKSDGSAWKVVDGALYLDPNAKGPKGEGGGDIITDEAFENYHLQLEWKLDSGGNSGVIIQAQEDPKYRYAWVTGPEIQVIDNNAHPDAKNKEHRAGDLYDLVAASPETVKPTGEWNLMEVVQNNGKLDLYLNGTKVVSTTQWDDNWSKLIADSKFKSMSDFGKFRKGKIALQDHGNPVWFRNIKIKSL